MNDIKTAITAPNGREFTIDEHGYIRGEVIVDLSDLIDSDLEGALDLFSDRLTGSDILMDIAYKALRVEDGSVVIEVSGDPSMIIEMSNDGISPKA